jgi:hypothetical protein
MTSSGALAAPLFGFGACVERGRKAPTPAGLSEERP